MFFKIKYFTVASLLLIITACGKKNAAEYAAYLSASDSGLTQKQARGVVQFSATYQPLDFVVSRQLESSERTEKGLETARQTYLGLQYFNFQIYTEGVAAGQNALKQAIEKQVGATKLLETKDYYNFGMQPDFGLVSGVDTLPCAFYHLEQTGNLGNRMSFLLGFKDDKKRAKPHFDTDLRLYYVDRMISKDTLYFTFSKEKLNHTPELEF